MRVTFTFDDQVLQRPRHLKLIQNNDPAYAIKPDQVYKPVHDFFAKYKNGGYPFTLLDLLHATAVKMLGLPSTKRWLGRSLFATGGLYLALDIGHNDLAVRQHFGDFTSGFSHQFGVALSVMSMSQAFGIPWDKLTPIPVRGKRTLDFIAERPDGNGWLQLEAKGVTSVNGRGNARRDISKKKNKGSQSSQQSNQSTAVNQTTMIGVIIQAVLQGGISVTASQRRASGKLEQGIIEIIDPEPDSDVATLHEGNQKAGLYWHYAGIAIFAGLYSIAKEFINRANALISGKARSNQLRNRSFDDWAVLEVPDRSVIGVQWRPSDIADLKDDVWFYQAVDINVIRDILAKDLFPSIQPYHYHEPFSRREEYVESILPDGSYFGIGMKSRDALRKVDQRETDFRGPPF